MCLFPVKNAQLGTESLPFLRRTNTTSHVNCIILRGSNHVFIVNKKTKYIAVHLRTFNQTLEFVCRSYDSEYVHLDLSILRISFTHPPSHPEEEVAGREAVSTQRMTERVLGSVTQFKPPVGVSEGLWDEQACIRLLGWTCNHWWWATHKTLH